jgi:hypothetical protein
VPVPAKLVVGLAGYALLAVVAALGFGPGVLGGGFSMLVLLVVPFVAGALSGRPWVAFAIFCIVLATALLPDRTVVETHGNSTTFTTNETSWVVTFPFALAAGICAYMGASMRPRRGAVA